MSRRVTTVGIANSSPLSGDSMQMTVTVVRWVALMLTASLSFGTNARAVPAFADQTGLHCVQCHVGAFGPQLTPVGRSFKLGGYTLRTNWDAVPVALMAIGSFVNTQKDQV